MNTSEEASAPAIVRGGSVPSTSRSSMIASTASAPAKLAAGAGLVILTPSVSKVAGKAVSKATGNAVGKATDNAVGKVKDTAVDKVKESAPAPLKAARKVGEALGGGKSKGETGV